MDIRSSAAIAMPEIIGSFRILRQLGAGGMGAVYLAERIAEFQQLVAIKVLYSHLFTEVGETSTEREAKLLAALDHPGIVRMLDLGATADGLRYIVMEYVDGLPLDMYCDQHRLTIRHRIELLLDIFDALEYAHRRLVIHADLKPENILVTVDGKPRLLDFGSATIVAGLGAEISSESFTQLYASPEQRFNERLTIASDVYSMGVVVQRVLGGVMPERVSLNDSRRDQSGLRIGYLTKAFSTLSEEVRTEIAGLRSTTPAGLIAVLRGDIEAILAKALERDPAKRFESLQAMTAEFRRFLAGYPIETRPAGRMTQVKKWMLRNRLVASLVSVLVFTFLLSSAGVVWRTREAAHKRQIAQTRLHELIRLTDALAGELYDSIHSLPASEAAQQDLLDSAHKTLGKLRAEAGDDPRLAMEVARGYGKLARTELLRTPLTQNALDQASDDIRSEVELLRQVPAGDPEVKRMLSELRELARLREGAVLQPAK